MDFKELFEKYKTNVSEVEVEVLGLLKDLNGLSSVFKTALTDQEEGKEMHWMRCSGCFSTGDHVGNKEGKNGALIVEDCSYCGGKGSWGLPETPAISISFLEVFRAVLRVGYALDYEFKCGVSHDGRGVIPRRQMNSEYGFDEYGYTVEEQIFELKKSSSRFLIYTHRFSDELKGNSKQILYAFLVNYTIGLGRALGVSWEQIEQACKEDKQ